MGRKFGGSAPFLGKVERCPHLTQSRVGRGLPLCQVPATSIQPFDHNKHGPKIWGFCPPFAEGERSPHLTQSRLCRGLAPYQVTSWSMQPFGRNRYGPKIGGCAPLGEGELGPHLTQCGQSRGLSACQVSSWSIQPFGHSAQTLQRDRTDRQRSDSIGRTVLQAVAQPGLVTFYDYDIRPGNGEPILVSVLHKIVTYFNLLT